MRYDLLLSTSAGPAGLPYTRTVRDPRAAAPAGAKKRV